MAQYMSMEVDINMDEMADALLSECYHVPSKLNAFLERMFEDDAKALNDFVLGKAPYDYRMFERALKEVLHEMDDKDVKELSWILIQELKRRVLPITVSDTGREDNV
jgi:hypothetical protein